MRKLFLVLLALTFSAPAAVYADVENYSSWRNLSQDEKAYYADGAFNGYATGWMSMAFALKSKDKEAYERSGQDLMLNWIDGINHCRADSHLGPTLMAEMIDNAYTRDVTLWSHQPMSVLMDEMKKLCKPWIEKSEKRTRPNP